MTTSIALSWLLFVLGAGAFAIVLLKLSSAKLTNDIRKDSARKEHERIVSEAEKIKINTAR